MTKRPTTTDTRNATPHKSRWPLLLLLLVPAALVWKEYPAIVRYLKIERM
jgi:hypothetical protein